MEAVLILAFVVVFVLSATTLGTDSRDGDDWVTHHRA